MNTLNGTVNWKGQTGAEVELEITIIRGYETYKDSAYCDGDRTEIEKKRAVVKNDYTLRTSNREFTELKIDEWQAKKENLPMAFSKNGIMIGVSSQEVANRINNKIDELTIKAEKDTDYQEYLSKREESVKAEKDYQNHVSMMNKAMTLSGDSM